MNGSVVTANTAGDRVDREHDVGRLDDDECGQERGRQAPAPLADDERRTAVAVGHGNEPAEETEHRVLLGLDGMPAGACQAEAGHDQEDAQQVDDPVGRTQDHGPGADEDGPEDDRPEDPPEQQAVLVRRRDGEGGEDDGEDEDVVDRERQLDQVAGQVLTAGRGAAGRGDPGPEPEGQRDPHGAPQRGLAERDGLGPAVEDEQVEGEHSADDGGQHQPRNEIG
jgi:hypothetical protein